MGYRLPHQRRREETAVKTYSIPDRRPVASGPWDNEPDKAVWIDPDTGLDCMIVRNRYGALCGYVGVPPGHPWHRKDYDEVPVEAHGGLTYSNLCDGNEEGGICHTPEPGRPADVWWFGFDCSHLGDLPPLMIENLSKLDPELAARISSRQTYRNFGYVQHQVTQLAAQAAAVKAGEEPT